MFTLQCLQFNVNRSMFSAQCSPFNVHQLMFTVQCSPFNVHHLMFTVQCLQFIVHRSMFSAQCSPFSVYNSIFNVQCSPLNVRRSILATQCSPFNVHFSTYMDFSGMIGWRSAVHKMKVAGPAAGILTLRLLMRLKVPSLKPHPKVVVCDDDHRNNLSSSIRLGLGCWV